MRAVVPVIAALLLAVPGPARAVETYEDCLTLIENDAEAAVSEALQWARFGGGPTARHCYALALLATGAPLSAADELMAIASEEPGLTDLERSNLMVQAGEILLDAGEDLSPAIAAEQAIRLAPKNAQAVGLRGAVRLKSDDYAGALQDFDAAIAAGGATAPLLSLRASAKRKLGNATAARDDAVWATEQDPAYPNAWLERGRAEALLKDKHAARQSLLKVIELDRGGTTARAAQLVLQEMDAGG